MFKPGDKVRYTAVGIQMGGNLSAEFQVAVVSGAYFTCTNGVLRDSRWYELVQPAALPTPTQTAAAYAKIRNVNEDEVGRYVAGPKDDKGNWARTSGAKNFGTRDAAVEHAIKLSLKQKGSTCFVQDKGVPPYVEVGYAKDGKFTWNPSFKKPYT